MPVRVRIKIQAGEKTVETAALANSGYEAETPQLLVPIRLARELGQWPPSPESETQYETAGGPLTVWSRPRACTVQVVEADSSSPLVHSDLIISPLADEALLSDKLIGELQLALEDVGRGLWRFRWEPKRKLRPSQPPLYWR